MQERGAIVASGKKEKESAQKITHVTNCLSAESLGKTCEYLSDIQNEIVKLAPLNTENLQRMRQDYDRVYGQFSFQELEKKQLPFTPAYVEGDTAFVDVKQCNDPHIQRNTNMMKKSGLIGGVISLLCFVTTLREDFDTIKEEKNAIIASIRLGVSRLESEGKNSNLSDLRELNKSIIDLCCKSIDIAEQELKKRERNTIPQPMYSVAPRVTLLPPPTPSLPSTSNSGGTRSTLFQLPKPVSIRHGR